MRGEALQGRGKNAQSLVNEAKTTGTGMMPGSWPWQSLWAVFQSTTVQGGGEGGAETGWWSC